MSWDADLYTKTVDGQPVEVGEWNYTHNTNGMVSTALEEGRARLAGLRPDTPPGIVEDKLKEMGIEARPLTKHWLIGHLGKSWFDTLDGLSGQEGAELLESIISSLEAEPERFRGMNPSNGWGSYDGVLLTLKDMAAKSRLHPSGTWQASG